MMWDYLFFITLSDAFLLDLERLGSDRTALTSLLVLDEKLINLWSIDFIFLTALLLVELGDHQIYITTGQAAYGARLLFLLHFGEVGLKFRLFLEGH